MDHQRPVTKLLAASAVIALAAGILLWMKEPSRARRTDPIAESAANSSEAEPTPALRAAIAEPAPTDLRPTPEAETVAASHYDPAIHPHPITPEHERIYHEVDLLDDAWHAVKGKDFAKARQLVDEHKRDYAGSNEHMDEGLLVLADCMEHPGPDTKARAQHYYDTKTFSQMRKRIRRLCLEVVPD